MNIGKLARLERFELPTFWFVGASVFFLANSINNLNGPPSLHNLPSYAKTRESPTFKIDRKRPEAVIRTFRHRGLWSR
jgi:hypothetical protein